MTRPAARLALLTGVALTLAACGDNPTAPTAAAAKSSLIDPGVSFATFTAPAGNVGGITTPAQSVLCSSRSYLGGANLQITGSTVSATSAANSVNYYSEYVTADVYLYRYNVWTKAWDRIDVRPTSVAVELGVRVVFPGYNVDVSKLPTVDFNNLAPGYYYSVRTFVGWWARGSSSGAPVRVGYQWINYDTAADYQNNPLAPAYLYTGSCYVK